MHMHSALDTGISEVFSLHSTRKGTFVKTTRVEYKLIQNWQNKTFFFSDIMEEEKTAKSEDSLAISPGNKLSYL